MIGCTLIAGSDPMAGMIAALSQPPKEPRNIVLFGAGVSRFAGHIIPKPPPLGACLLEELSVFDSRTWGVIPEKYSSKFAENFELGMEEIREGEIEYFPGLMKSLSIYFTQFWLERDGLDSYTRFVRALRKRGTATRTILSTLNYECLLEHGASLAGLMYSHFQPEAIDGNASVWKLHGSCAFLPGDGVQVAGMKYDGATIFEGGIRFVRPTEAGSWLRGKTSLYSVMCMFAAGKPVQFHPTFFRAVHDAWGSRVRGAGAVLIAGARPNPLDRHVWAHLGGAGGRVGYVGSRSEYEEWLPSREGRPTLYLGSNFESVVSEAADFISEY